MNTNKQDRIYLSPPYQSGREMELVGEVLAGNWLSTVGNHISRFENLLCKTFQFPHVVAVNSGTSALHLILKKINIAEGDVVLVSDLTFIGGVSPILYERGRPVFIDSEKGDWNISPELLKEYLENNRENPPKALIVVHLYGMPCQIKRIREICDQYGVILIEDCAEALGTKVDGQYAGTFGDFAFLSFNGNKTITTSGGGVIITPSKEDKEYFIYLSMQAKKSKAFYLHEEIGFNYRMSNLLAALGIAQLTDFEFRVNRKKAINLFYRKSLEDIGFQFPEEREGIESSYWLSCALIPDTVEADTLISQLDNGYNIEARRVWNPMHRQPVFRNAEALLNGVSEQLFKNGICLPSGVGLSDDQLKYIVDAIKKIISH